MRVHTAVRAVIQVLVVVTSSSVAISPNNWVTADYYDTLRVQIYYKRVYYYAVRENATENVWSPWPSHRITADNASRMDANSRP